MLCVPEGVIAEVEMVQIPTEGEFRRYVVAREEPDVVRDYVDETARVIAVAVESTNPEVEVGDESRFTIEREGRSSEEILDAIRTCPGPPKRSKLARAIGKKGVCPAVTIRHNLNT